MAVINSSPDRLELVDTRRKLIFWHASGRWPLVSLQALDGGTIARFVLSQFSSIQIIHSVLLVGSAMLDVSGVEIEALKSWLAIQSVDITP